MSHSRKQYFEHERRVREFENGHHDSSDKRDHWQKRQGMIFDFDAIETNRQLGTGMAMTTSCSLSSMMQMFLIESIRCGIVLFFLFGAQPPARVVRSQLIEGTAPGASDPALGLCHLHE
jgi:hypothetical protein